jgi:DNA repair exonuclease SbcCD nuclease subunit
VIGIIADVHLANHRQMGGQTVAGLNLRARETAGVLQTTARLAQEAGCTDLIVAGDLFDTARPAPQLITAALDALRGPRLTALVGNHDQVSSTPGDHALGPFGYAVDWEVVDRPLVFGRLAMVPFERSTDQPALDRLASVLASGHLDPGALLVIHAGIDDGTTPPWLRGSPGSVELGALVDLCTRHGITAVCAGDWHVQRRWDVRGVQVAQVGALVPTGWDNPGLDGYGGLVTWDGKTLRTYQIPGPRFLAVTSVDGLASHLASAHPEHLIRAQVTVPLDQIASTEQALQDLATRHPRLVGWRVLPDGRMLAEQTQDAVAAVQDTTHQADRLAEYLARCPIPEGVDRMRVQALCEGALAQGADA